MFIHETPEWAALGPSILDRALAEIGPLGLTAEDFGLVLVVPGATGPEGFAHRGMRPVYPCSLVKAFHLIHALAALEEGRIPPHGEIDRAMRDMIRWSSNTATNYVIDLVTGTTGDTLLDGAEYLDWVSKRERLNRFWWALGWPEWAGCNIPQKLMDDTRYGREAQFAGTGGTNLNRLTPLACARLLWELFEGSLPLSAPMRARAQAILHRSAASPDAGKPGYQLAGFLGGDLPEGVEIWSKAGHNLWTGDPNTSWFRHDMIRMAEAGHRPLIAVATTAGQPLAETHPEAMPRLGRLIHTLTRDITRG